ncbi:MAG TPA: GNAT family N-acetyltransferase [Capsulimonadaceae bacterium]
MASPASPQISIAIAEPGPVLDHCYAIRRMVFVEEQQVDANLEFDGLDETATHYVAFVDSKPAGCARLVDCGEGRAKIGRVAVLASHRRRGIGAAIMKRVIADAATQGFREAVLHAQLVACPFYAALGFERYGDEFLEANIPHCRMKRPL